jgi:hypothetical protein
MYQNLHDSKVVNLVLQKVLQPPIYWKSERVAERCSQRLTSSIQVSMYKVIFRGLVHQVFWSYHSIEILELVFYHKAF